jgi:hypothetical protein
MSIITGYNNTRSVYREVCGSLDNYGPWPLVALDDGENLFINSKSIMGNMPCHDLYISLLLALAVIP